MISKFTIALFAFSVLFLSACQTNPPVRPVDWNGTPEEVYTATGTPWDLLRGKIDAEEAARYIRSSVTLAYFEEVNGARGGTQSDRQQRNLLRKENNQAQRAWQRCQKEERKKNRFFFNEELLTTVDAINAIRNYELAAMRAAVAQPTQSPASGSGAVESQPINSSNPKN